MKGSARDWALFVIVALAVVVVFGALALQGRGGTSTTADTSPSPAASLAVPAPLPSWTAAESPNAATWPSATPTLRAQTMPGTLVFTRVVKREANYDIYLVRSDGTGLRRLTDTPDIEEHAYWSPDGKRIVYGVFETGSLWVMDAHGAGKVRLGAGHGPHWSPDGRRIVYENAGVWVVNANGNGRRRVVDGVYTEVRTPSWAANGVIVFESGGDLYGVHPDGSGLVRLTRDAGMLQPAVSPDGTRVAGYVPTGDRIVTAPLQDDATSVTLLETASQYFSDGGEPTAAWTTDGKKLVLGSSNYGETRGSRLYLVNADGSGLSRIPHVTRALCPDWRPASVSP